MSKHDLLSQIDQELSGIQVTDVVEVAGHKYGLHVLERHEESYARSLFPPETTVLQAYADQSLPVLATALRSVDGISVEDLFVPGDDVNQDTLKLIQSPEGMLRWRRVSVLRWLNGKPGAFIEDLWMQYMDLKMESQRRLENLRPLSKRTPSGAFEPSSSLEKEFSSATPASVE